MLLKNILLTHTLVCVLFTNKSFAQGNSELPGIRSLDTLITREGIKPSEKNEWQTFSKNQDSIIELNDLFSLKEYLVTYDNYTRTYRAKDPQTGTIVDDLNTVERAILYVKMEDTLTLSHEQFPELKYLTVRGTAVNHLLCISKLTGLQYLDLAMELGDENMASYALFFPDEFWNLGKLQVLKIKTNTMSYISERISELKHLKILEVKDYKQNIDPILPWSLLLLDELRLLVLPLHEDSVYQNAFITLIEKNAHFTVTRSKFPMSDVDTTLLQNGVLDHYSKEGQYTIKNQVLSSIFDRLTLELGLDQSLTKLHGTSFLSKNGDLLQKRYYQFGEPHGKWDIEIGSASFTRKYNQGIPESTWKLHFEGQGIFSKFAKAKLKFDWHKNTMTYTLMRPKYTFRYHDFNDLYYFQ